MILTLGWSLRCMDSIWEQLRTWVSTKFSRKPEPDDTWLSPNCTCVRHLYQEPMAKNCNEIFQFNNKQKLCWDISIMLLLLSKRTCLPLKLKFPFLGMKIICISMNISGFCQRLFSDRHFVLAIQNWTIFALVKTNDIMTN
jgi:hypothetical protein